MTDALYTSDGDRFVPSVLTTGPWDPAAQHGGAPAALLTRAVEAVEAPGPMQVARVTFELLRPVPLQPLRIRSDILRPGRKVQLVQATLTTDDDVEVMRATALRVRTADLAVPTETLPDDPPPAGPEQGRVTAFPIARHEGPAFHVDATEIRSVEGGFDRAGPAAAWIRLAVPVVDDEEPSPGVRVAAASDFGNGLSWVLPRAEWIFINPDLTLHLFRLPVGEWVGLRSTTFPAGDGVGMAESALYDGEGRIGRAVQSLLLDHT